LLKESTGALDGVQADRHPPIKSQILLLKPIKIVLLSGLWP